MGSELVHTEVHDAELDVPDRLKLVRSDMEDWFVIERAEHDGRDWLEMTEYGAVLMLSSRITRSDIEGDAGEMRAIADAIESRGSVSFKRCMASWSGSGFLMMSPRNDEEAALVSVEAADDLARQIREELGQ